MEYRHELKFMVSDIMLEKIRYRLQPLMQPDSHITDQYYTIRSLYFDDLYDTGMYENEDGVDNRSKYRIRMYNNDAAFLKLERKSKYRGMTRKKSAAISAEAAKHYITEDTLTAAFSLSTAPSEKLLNEFHCKHLMPKCIVEYDRSAFVEALGNVRVTFDQNIRGSIFCNEFFTPTAMLFPVLPDGMHILEIKYDEFLPQYILQAVDIGALRKQSFSKYCIVRKKLH